MPKSAFDRYISRRPRDVHRMFRPDIYIPFNEYMDALGGFLADVKNSPLEKLPLLVFSIVDGKNEIWLAERHAKEFTYRIADIYQAADRMLPTSYSREELQRGCAALLRYVHGKSGLGSFSSDRTRGNAILDRFAEFRISYEDAPDLALIMAYDLRRIALSAAVKKRADRHRRGLKRAGVLSESNVVPLPIGTEVAANFLPRVADQLERAARRDSTLSDMASALRTFVRIGALIDFADLDTAVVQRIGKALDALQPVVIQRGAPLIVKSDVELAFFGARYLFDVLLSTQVATELDKPLFVAASQGLGWLIASLNAAAKSKEILDGGNLLRARMRQRAARAN